MDRGQRFFSAIAVFIVVAFFILFFVKNVLLQGVLMLVLFIALLKVLYDIAKPLERKKIPGQACDVRVVPELEVGMDGTSKQRLVPSKKKRKARKGR